MSSEQTVKSFLQKPSLIQTLTWSTSFTMGTQLADIDPVDKLMSNPVWWDKIKGNMNFRGTAVFTLLSNATPYHMGMLSARYIPCGSRLGSLNSSRRAHMIPTSQLPGTYMSTVSNKVQIKIPYIAPTAWFDPNGSAIGWGPLYIDVISQLRAGVNAPTTVAIQVWLHFEDFETSAPVVPQGDTSSGPQKMKKFKGRQRAKDVPEAERKPISFALGSAAKAAEAFGGIPLLSSLAGPTAWFLNAASSAAAAFGWSKPTDTTTMSRGVPGGHHYAVNASGISSAQPFGVLADNKVALLPGIGGHDLDEMSIDYVKRRWSYFTEITWTTSNTTEYTIASYDLAPGQFKAAYTTNVWAHTPISFLGYLFDMWRGSIRMRFTIMATQFHSGSIEVRYNPGSDAGVPAAAQAQFVQREIMDIQKGNQFCLEFPYSLAYNYITKFEKYGKVSLHVVTPLHCPSTVPNTVSIMVEVSGADDLEFAVPSNFCGSPYIPTGGAIAPQNVMMVSEVDHLESVEPKRGIVEAQGQIEEDLDHEIVCGPIGDSSVRMDNNYSALYCMGEKVLSLLQLLKMSHRITLRGAAITGTSFQFDPTFLSAHIGSGTGSLPPVLHSDWLSLISSLYAFRRGGYRYRYSQSSESNWNICLLNDYQNAGAANLATGTGMAVGGLSNSEIQSQYPIHTVSSAMAGWHVQVPYYAKTPFIFNRFYTNGVSANSDENPRRRLICSSGSALNTSVLSRSAAEDFQLGFFIGVPLILEVFTNPNVS